MAHIDLNEINRLREKLITKYPLSFSGGISVTINEINRLPNADVVEVVRCKNCRFWKGNGDEKERFALTGLARCIRPLGEWTKDVDCGENDFCSCGERRE